MRVGVIQSALSNFQTKPCDCVNTSGRSNVQKRLNTEQIQNRDPLFVIFETQPGLISISDHIKKLDLKVVSLVPSPSPRQSFFLLIE